MSLLTGLPSAICCFFIGTNIPINIDICKSFMIYFQIFTTFGYKSLKNSDIYLLLDTVRGTGRSIMDCLRLEVCDVFYANNIDWIFENYSHICNKSPSRFPLNSAPGRNFYYIPINYRNRKLEMRRGCIADWLGADGVLEVNMDDSTRAKI